MKTLKSCGLFITLLLYLVQNANSEVKLPHIFSANMVLQQGIEIPVWGWANKGERITVSLNEISVRTRCDKTGKWMVKLPAQSYGGPYTLIVKGKNTIELKNVLIGEVWICSGQSNMEFQVQQSINAQQEIADANYPKIRLFQVARDAEQFPKDDLSSGEWVECSPKQWQGSLPWAIFSVAIFIKILTYRLD